MKSMKAGLRISRSRVVGSELEAVRVAARAWRTYPLASGDLLLAEQPTPSVAQLSPVVRVLSRAPRFEVTELVTLPCAWWSTCSFASGAMLFASAWYPGSTEGGRLVLVAEGCVVSQAELPAPWSPPLLVSDGRDRACLLWQHERSAECVGVRIEQGTIVLEESTRCMGLGAPLAGWLEGDELTVLGGFGGPHTCVRMNLRAPEESRVIEGIPRGLADAELLAYRDSMIAAASFGGDWSRGEASAFLLPPGADDWSRQLLGMKSRMAMGKLGPHAMVLLGTRAGRGSSVAVVGVEVVGEEGESGLSELVRLELDVAEGVIFSGADRVLVALTDGEVISMERSPADD